MPGKLELIIGPMFSGKSTELIRRIRLLHVINKKVLVIKPQLDNRYSDNKITSHNFESSDCIVLKELQELNENEILNYHTIVVDEGQFFDDLKKTIISWVDKYDVNIIVGGLDGDFERNPMGQILDLIPYSNACIKLNSLCNVCQDGTEGCFSFRKNNSKNQVLIGGQESYIPVCRKHYLELNKTINI